MQIKQFIGPVLSLLIIAAMSGDVHATPKPPRADATAGFQRRIEAVDPDDLNQPDGAVAGIIRRYTVDRGSLDRFYTAPYSPIRRNRFKQFYSEWLDELRKLDFESMSQQERVDFLLFRNHLEHELKALDLEARRFAEVEPLIPFSKDLIGLEDARRLMKPSHPPEVAALLSDVNKKIHETRKTLEAQWDGKPVKKTTATRSPAEVNKSVANRAFEAIGLLRRMLKNWFGFYDGYDPAFTWWVTAPYKSLDSTLQNYASFLREKLVGVKAEDKSAIVGDPIGREALLSELRHEMIFYTPEELIDIAIREMTWCEREMVRSSRELGFGDKWLKALDKVKTLHVEPGRQPQIVQDLANEAIQFVESRNLMTIPALAKETWRMEMLSPEQQLIAPFFLGGEVIQVAFPTVTMTHEQKMMSMRGNNVHFARATVHHELIPGHHMQGFMNARYRTYRRIFSTPFWGEGWALYWELLLWDLDFPKSPENRIGMLFWRMHRCARIIFSLNFHLGKMTPEECIDFLVHRVGHERENATAEVRRSFSGQYGPLYQSAYLLGGLQFRALRRELVESGKMTDREFHDTILRNNSIPVEMVRALLTGEQLDREHTPRWKFDAVSVPDR